MGSRPLQVGGSFHQYRLFSFPLSCTLRRYMSHIAREELLTSRSAELREKLGAFFGHSFLLAITVASGATVLFILFFIFRDALPFFRTKGLALLLQSSQWRPTADDATFGALGIFVGSGLVTLGSCLLAVPMGITAAVCLSDVVPFGVRQVIKPIIELLAAIPSVAYGFFALVIFAPILQEDGGFILAVAWWVVAAPLTVLAVIVISDLSTTKLPDRLHAFGRVVIGLGLAAAGFWGLSYVGGKISEIQISSGVNALNASIMLALMALPTVVSVCEDSLTAVGRELREGSYALGATRAETIVKVVIPAAKGGILAAVLLGIMRAVGETMVVLMAAGNMFEVPTPWYNLLSGVRTLTATIALEMGEAARGGTHYHALFALGFCLLVFTFVLNLLSEWAVKRTSPKGA